MEKQEKKLTNLTKLAQIQELSEEHSSYKEVKPKTVVIAEKQMEKAYSKWNFCFSLDCLRRFLTKYIKKTKKNQFDINEEEMTKEVEKIKKRKSTIQTLLPINKNPKTKTLVLDLDETLIFTSFKKKKRYDFSLEVEVKGSMEKVYVTKRFGLDIFLFQMSQLYQIVIFTAGMPEYTDSVLKNIDLQRRISHVLYREHCTVLNGSYFLKNLSHLGRNLKQTILVDDNSMAGILHPQIFYQIEAFHGDEHDRKLLRLIDFLKIMEKEDDFSCLREKKKDFQNSKVRFSGQFKKEPVVEDTCGTSKGCLEGDSRVQI